MDNFVSSSNLPKESNPLAILLKAQDDPTAQIMTLRPEGKLLGFTHVLGHFVPTGLSGQWWPPHNALLFPSKGIGDTALARPV